MAKIIRKSGFKTKDEVYFDDFKKEGVIVAINQDKLKIFSNKAILFRHSQVVYKKSEMLGDRHWDTLKKTEKIEILNKHNVSKDLARRDWQDIPSAVKQAIYKEDGSFSGINTDTQNVYNPVTSDKTVSDRIKDELSEEDSEDSNSKKSDDELIDIS